MNRSNEEIQKSCPPFARQIEWDAPISRVKHFLY